MPRFATRILRFLIKLVLGLLAAVFAVSLLAVALLALVWTVLKAVLTGQKPTAPRMFGRFQQFSTQTVWPGASRADSQTSRHDVVDVEVREVRHDKHLP